MELDWPGALVLLQSRVPGYWNYKYVSPWPASNDDLDGQFRREHFPKCTGNIPYKTCWEPVPVWIWRRQEEQSTFVSSAIARSRGKMCAIEIVIPTQSTFRAW